MIREWQLGHFKSVSETTSLQVRPLTVLAGPNSSGKSSLIQSILLVSQTLASKVGRRHLVLNGDLVKLGSFDDVLNAHATERLIDLGFALELDLAHRRWASPIRDRMWYAAAHLEPGDSSSAQIFTTMKFGPSASDAVDDPDKPAKLQADLQEARLGIRIMKSRDDQTLRALASMPEDLRIHRRTSHEIATLVATSNADALSSQRPIDPADLRYRAHFAQRLLQAQRRYRRYFGEDAPRDLVAVRLQHFIPDICVHRSNLLSRQLEQIIVEIIDRDFSRLESVLSEWSSGADPIRREVAEVLRTRAEVAGQSVGIFAARASRSPRSREGGGAGDLWTQLHSAVTERLGTEFGNRTTFEYGRLPDDLVAFNSLVNEFFASVRYLGPLRDDPKPVYGIASTADPRDVGSKGQFTAAVLDLYAGRMIDVVRPRERVPMTMRLDDAVQLWMTYFAIADGVTTTEEGKIGHRLWIHPTGMHRQVDLTNVGVGVSQLLPIIVMCLIADTGSLLMFEQPELHLHPAVQTLLGDFFVAVMRSGRQCILETHSEYLINRLRLRVAEAPREDTLHRNIMIHFVERDGARSRFREVQINEFGAIAEWPKGFFDQGPDEAERILAAAHAKRRGATNHGGSSNV